MSKTKRKKKNVEHTDNRNYKRIWVRSYFLLKSNDTKLKNNSQSNVSRYIESRHQKNLLKSKRKNYTLHSNNKRNKFNNGMTTLSFQREKDEWKINISNFPWLRYFCKSKIDNKHLIRNI